MRFTVLLVLSAAAGTLATAIKRDAITIKSDTATIDTQTRDLDSSITSFPTTDGTLEQALAIHGAAVKLGHSLNKAGSDAKATSSIGESDAQNIVGTIKDTQGPTEHALKGLVDKKEAVTKLGVDDIGTVVHADLVALRDGTVGFIGYLLAVLSDKWHAQLSELADNYRDAFAPAIAAYAP